MREYKRSGNLLVELGSGSSNGDVDDVNDDYDDDDDVDDDDDDYDNEYDDNEYT